jgi:hypothetical protein
LANELELCERESDCAGRGLGEEKLRCLPANTSDDPTHFPPWVKSCRLP